MVSNNIISSHGSMNADDMSVDMLRYVAEQASAYAQNNPYNPQAQQQAAWWAERLAAAQRTALVQLLHQQQQAAAQAQAPGMAGMPTPSFQPGLAATQSAPPPLGAQGSLSTSAVHYIILAAYRSRGGVAGA